MSLETMKPFAAALLCLAAANVLCLAEDSSTNGPNDPAKAPSPANSITTTTGSSAKEAYDSSKNDNLISTQKESAAPTTASQLTVSVSAHITGNESSTANKTDATERGNDTSTSVHRTSLAPTTASQLTTHITGKGSSIANETGVIERENDTFTSVHKTSSAPTTAPQLTTLVADKKTEHGRAMTSGSKHGQTTPPLPSGSNIILPVFIPLGIVLFLAVAIVLYKMCKKTPPGDEAQNATEKPASKNESVKLLSVKTSPEAGEHSSQRRNKTLQNDEASPHLDHKYV